ncbi:unnamed protein product [Cuscuta epithymum]|uniref:Uncharacterized protein n=1 Tax=Cuscuta epithymum TaxID=186058 RepID=A0AAV0EHU1_9ASTE|nr:unnamed protein product [Cuscuta epithymum]
MKLCDQAVFFLISRLIRAASLEIRSTFEERESLLIFACSYSFLVVIPCAQLTYFVFAISMKLCDQAAFFYFLFISSLIRAASSEIRSTFEERGACQKVILMCQKHFYI